MRVRPRGLAFRGVTDEGLRFVAADSTVLLYGHATWIDARGARTPVPARFIEGEIALTVPAAVLERSRYPAVLDPYVWPLAVPVDDPMRMPRIGHSPAVAFGAGRFLVVQAEPLRALTDVAHLVGALVTPPATPTGSAPVQRFDVTPMVATPTFDQPAVAFDGTQFRVVARIANATSTSLWLGTVDPSTGTVREVGIVSTRHRASADLFPSLDCNGSGVCLAAYQDRNPSNDMPDVATVRFGSGVTTPSVIAATSSADIEVRPAVRWHNDAFQVVWAHASLTSSRAFDLQGSRLRPTDTAFAMPTRLNPTGQNPGLACNATECLLVWEEAPLARSTLVMMVHLSLMGMPVEMPTEVLPARTMQRITEPTVTWSGAGWRVVWREGDTNPIIRGIDITPTGTIEPSDLFAVTMGIEQGVQPAAASNGSGLSFVAYTRSAGGVDGRFVGPHPSAGSRCTVDSECPSRVCLGGFCCAARCPDGINPCQLPVCAARTGECSTVPNPSCTADAGPDAAPDASFPDAATSDVMVADAPAPDAAFADTTAGPDGPLPTSGVSFRGSGCACSARSPRGEGVSLTLTLALASLCARARSRRARRNDPAHSSPPPR